MIQNLAKPQLPAVVASSKLPDVSQPAILPAVLSEVKPVDGFRYPQWQMRPMAPAERMATQQALVAVEARCAPTAPERIMWHIGKLLSHWDSNQPALVKDQIMADWKLDLAEESEAHIAEACARWRRTQSFRPKVSDILGLIEGIKARDAETIRRARVLLGLEPPRRWEKQPAAAPATRERTGARAMLAALADKMGARTRKAPASSPPLRTAAEVREEVRQSIDPAAAEKLASLRKHA